jgi:hypothetical protein
MNERRKDNMIKSVVLPVVVAVITGIGSSYFTVYANLAVLESRFAYVEKDIISIKDVILEVNRNQTELAKRGEWMLYQERRTDALERAVEILAEQAKDQYTRTEAKKDFDAIKQVIKNHHH